MSSAPLPPGPTDRQALHVPKASTRLAGRIALVFGAGSSGVIVSNGQAAAIAYARAGAKVIAADQDAVRAEETAAIIRAEGGAAMATQGDVASDDDVSRIVGMIDTADGRLDILHNNVGITSPGATVGYGMDAWRRVLDVNLTGAFQLTRAVLHLMLRQRRGVITHISSVAAIRFAGIAYPAYAASKAGLNQLTTVIALEHARDGIRANTILPGMMHTSLVSTQLGSVYADPSAALAERSARCPMGFMGDAWDVANMAVFLASDEARYVTGQTLVVDGGLSATCG
jgi:NAD(P)-dependent dehydrogenase (short-subunit alcohol dehydrogenase family)